MDDPRRTITRHSIAHDNMARVRTVHLAEGVLMGVLGLPAEKAFAALMDAARASGESACTIAAALVAIAEGRPPNGADDIATVTVRCLWGDRLFNRSPGRHVTV
jgi:hypothetical protein